MEWREVLTWKFIPPPLDTQDLITKVSRDIALRTYEKTENYLIEEFDSIVLRYPELRNMSQGEINNFDFPEVLRKAVAELSIWINNIDEDQIFADGD